MENGKSTVFGKTLSLAAANALALIVMAFPSRAGKMQGKPGRPSQADCARRGTQMQNESIRPLWRADQAFELYDIFGSGGRDRTYDQLINSHNI